MSADAQSAIRVESLHVRRGGKLVPTLRKPPSGFISPSNSSSGAAEQPRRTTAALS
jgi:hypothetical protein